MIFLDNDIPIEKLQGRTRNVWMPAFPLGKCKILDYTKDAIKMEVIESSRSHHLNKIVFISKHTFFMSLSDEHIDNYDTQLPAINLPLHVKLYEKE